jgi:iron complex outermembrane receptor protein
MKGILIFISVVLVTSVSSAQISADSVAAAYTTGVMEVVGSADKPQDLSGQKNSHSHFLFGFRPHHDLGVLLERSGVAIQNVTGAPGSSATVRFGGFGSDHSVFLWNGVPLNALSLGTCDVSLIPAFFMDDAVLFRNPAVSEMPLSGLGMTLGLNALGQSPERSYVKLFGGMNSLRNATLALEQFHTLFSNEPDDRGDEKKPWLQRATWRTRLILQDMKNEFAYHDRYIFENPQVEQQHNNSKHQAMMNDVVLRTRTGVFSLHHWYAERFSMLPALMGKYASGTAEQADDINRSVLKWAFDRKKISAEISSALFLEALQYRDQPLNEHAWLIDSKVNSRSLFQRARLNCAVADDFRMGLHLAFADQRVSNSNYAEGSSGLRWLIAGGHVRWKPGQFRILLDGQVDSRTIRQGPAATLSLEYLRSGDRCSVQPYITLSRRFRAPDMNELFWMPGGNRNLLSESAISVRSGVELNCSFSRLWRMTFTPAAHYSEVKNWIQWIPSADGYWTPVNYSYVESRNVELPVTMQFSPARRRMFMETRLIFTRAVSIGNGSEPESQMIYTPEWTHAAAFGYTQGAFDMSVRHRFMSTRFTDEANSAVRQLPEYHVFGFSVDYHLNVSSMSCIIGIDADNLLNVQYESVRAFALPGRVVSATLSISFQTSEKNELNEK